MKKLFSIFLIAIGFATLSGCAVYETDRNVVYRQSGAVIYDTSPNYYIYSNRQPIYVRPPAHIHRPPPHVHRPPPPGYRPHPNKSDRIPPEYRR